MLKPPIYWMMLKKNTRSQLCVLALNTPHQSSKNGRTLHGEYIWLCRATHSAVPRSAHTHTHKTDRLRTFCAFAFTSATQTHSGEMHSSDSIARLGCVPSPRLHNVTRSVGRHCNLLASAAKLGLVGESSARIAIAVCLRQSKERPNSADIR